MARPRLPLDGLKWVAYEDVAEVFKVTSSVGREYGYKACEFV